MPPESTQERTLWANSPGDIDLLDNELAAFTERSQIEAQLSGPSQQQSEFLVEDEHRGAFAAFDRRQRKVERQE